MYSKNKYNNFLKERKKLEEAQTQSLKRKAVDEELCELKDTRQCLLEDCKSLLESADKLAKKVKGGFAVVVTFLSHKNYAKTFFFIF